MNATHQVILILTGLGIFGLIALTAIGAWQKVKLAEDTTFRAIRLAELAKEGGKTTQENLPSTNLLLD